MEYKRPDGGLKIHIKQLERFAAQYQNAPNPLTICYIDKVSSNHSINPLLTLEMVLCFNVVLLRCPAVCLE